MTTKNKPALPAEGAAFAFPLGDGRFSVCRVILGTSSERAKRWDKDSILVVCSSWIGNEIPSVIDPALRPILYLTHNYHECIPEVVWISDEPPEDLILIGTIKPTAEEQTIPCEASGG